MTYEHRIRIAVPEIGVELSLIERRC